MGVVSPHVRCKDNNNQDSWQGGLWDGRKGYARVLRKHHPVDSDWCACMVADARCTCHLSAS
jgi:hypothetical protein